MRGRRLVGGSCPSPDAEGRVASHLDGRQPSGLRQPCVHPSNAPPRVATSHRRGPTTATATLTFVCRRCRAAPTGASPEQWPWTPPPPAARRTQHGRAPPGRGIHRPGLPPNVQNRQVHVGVRMRNGHPAGAHIRRWCAKDHGAPGAAQEPPVPRNPQLRGRAARETRGGDAACLHHPRRSTMRGAQRDRQRRGTRSPVTPQHGQHPVPRCPHLLVLGCGGATCRCLAATM